MPTDIVGGTTAAVAGTNINIDLDAWSMELAINTVRYRTFASEWMKSKPVSAQGQGQFSGTIQFGSASTAPLPTVTGGTVNLASLRNLSATFTADTGCTFTGTINIVGGDFQRPSADRMTGTFRFEFDGECDQTWAES